MRRMVHNFLCPPNSLLNTDAALETLKELDQHERHMEEQAKCAKELETDEVGFDRKKESGI